MTLNDKNLRGDYKLIVELMEEGSRVLDLGCGDGELLYLLRENKKVTGRGVEISEECIRQCIAKGLSVEHGDLDQGLAEYSDKSFDYVLLCQTLQTVHKPKELILEMLRVGRKGIVSFPNFGQWDARRQLIFGGRVPVVPSLPYQWYNTPNLHFLTIQDFRDFCRRLEIEVIDSWSLKGQEKIKLLPNLRGEVGVFLLEGKNSSESRVTS
jgi:methionine biosynthesis protein MetW